MSEPTRAIETELPEYQIFSVLRKGEQEPIGPYSQGQLLTLLREGRVAASDLVKYPEIEDWRPISQVFDFQEQINFEDHGQDKRMFEAAFTTVDHRSEPDESIYYIATQHFPAMSLTAAVRLTAPKSLALTDHRFCVLKHRMMGDIEMDDHPLEQVDSVSVELANKGDHGVFRIHLKSGEDVKIDRIPVQQLLPLEEKALLILNGELRAEAETSG